MYNDIPAGLSHSQGQPPADTPGGSGDQNILSNQAHRSAFLLPASGYALVVL